MLISTRHKKKKIAIAMLSKFQSPRRYDYCLFVVFFLNVIYVFFFERQLYILTARKEGHWV